MTAPIDKIQKGSISMAVFENNFGKTLTLQKGYKKKGTEEWVNSNINLFLNELPKVKEIVDEMYTKYKTEIDESIKKFEENQKKE